MKRYLRYVLSTSLVCIAPVRAASHTYKIVINPEIIAEYQKTIGPFLQKRKKQNGLLNTGIGGFFAKLSGVNVEEARAFLARSFANQRALDKAIKNLSQDETCMCYMQKILGLLSPSAIRRKSTKKLPELMRANKYPGFNGSETPWKDKKVTDTEFYNGAACSFMLYHLVESDGRARIKEQVSN